MRVPGKLDVPTTPDQRRWAEALAIERLHGDKALAYVEERVRHLALRGDERGVQRFREIGERLDQLRGGATQ